MENQVLLLLSKVPRILWMRRSAVSFRLINSLHSGQTIRKTDAFIHVCACPLVVLDIKTVAKAPPCRPVFSLLCIVRIRNIFTRLRLTVAVEIVWS